VLGRAIYLYVDARSPILDPEAGETLVDLTPRLLFDNPALWQTVLKLASLIEAGSPPSSHYAEALGVVLTHELLRLDGGTAAGKPAARGGLAGWQQRVVQEYIEAHLAEQVPLAKLAELTGLSRFHLSRAFKQSFGTPPHRFHMSRRIECAKTLLSKPTLSVTDIALAVGFSETSSFTTAFRKLAGRTPTEYRRSLL
jgi:AraC family transcriptional regulator